MSFSVATSGIVSQAFRLMEMSPVSSLGDDSEQAVAAAEQYPVALDICLVHADWSFASRVEVLPPVSGEVSLDAALPYLFRAPADMVRVQRVLPACAAWRLDADRLRTDATPVELRYTARLDDESKASGLFRTAVSFHLAGLLAPRWTTSANRAAALLDQGGQFLVRAAAADRRNASTQRYDGRPALGDWAAEAVS